MTKQDEVKRFTLRYPEKLHKKIKADAENWGISIGAMLRIILNKYYKNK